MSGKRNASKAHGGTHYYYYRCNSEHTEDTSCAQRYVPVQLVEDTIWQFAYEFIQDPEKLLRAMLEVQEEDAQKYDELGAQLASLTALIAEREGELSSLVDQRTKTKIPTLAAILDTKTEEYAEAIEELKKRRDVLTEERLNAPFSFGNIQEVVSEIAELRQIYEALHAIDQKADFEAKLALIQLMDLTATLKGETVDIHYLRKTYSRPLRLQMPTEASR